MFDRRAALECIQDAGAGRASYVIRKGSISVCLRKVDTYNEIYRITVYDYRSNCTVVRSVEEMTAEQAVDRFQEFLTQVELAEVLFGWIGAT